MRKLLLCLVTMVSLCCAGTALDRQPGADYRARAPGHRMSALQDVDAGRPLEVNETLGHACDKARSLQLELPLLECFRRLTAATDRMRRDAIADPTGQPPPAAVSPRYSSSGPTSGARP